MAYIGREPQIGNFQVCDAISVVNGQAAYTMQVGGTNVLPETANHMIVSLNGVIQKPNSSYTISGSTITFSSNLATGDVIDFIQILGSVLDLGVPSDATVTQAKTNFVSTSSAAGLQIKGDGTTDGTLQLNCSQNSHGIKLKSPAHSTSSSYTLTFPGTDPSADKFLKTDGSGNLSFADVSAGITEADMHRITTNFTGNVEPVTNNWERVDDVTFSKIGTGISQSSGIWTFGATGLYKVVFRISANRANSPVRYVYNHINTTHDNSTYVEDTVGWGSISDDGGQTYMSAQCSTFINVTNVSNVKFKVGVNSDSNSTTWMGSTNTNYTYIEVIRLGDSQ